MTVEPLLPATEPDWTDAEEVATRHRNSRLHRSPRRAHRDRIFGPIIVIAWLAATVAALTRFQAPTDLGYNFELASFGGLLLFGVVGFWWAGSTGRYLLRGSSASIRAALPQAARKNVQRQLALREPLDPQHASVVLELAHQTRELTGGQVLFLAFYVPMYLNIAQSPHDWIAPAFLALGVTALTTGAIFLTITHRRLTRLLQQHGHDAPSDHTSPTNV